MGKVRKISVIAACLLFAACGVTYDLPVVYHKNFQPGTHALLRFDGYYSQAMEGKVKPFYLYRDGSVWFGEAWTAANIASVELAKKDPAIAHSWGNYKVDADTILIERFNRVENTNNYRRIITRGIIGSNTIQWFERQENRQNPVKTDYQTTFVASSAKPDSAANWTRTKEQFNK